MKAVFFPTHSILICFMYVYTAAVFYICYRPKAQLQSYQSFQTTLPFDAGISPQRSGFQWGNQL